MSGEWSSFTPQDVTAQNGLCAQIPCHYRYPSHLNNKPRIGIWFNSEMNNDKNVALHSKNSYKESTKFRHRTRLSGDLGEDDCSLVIDNVTLQDAGPYFFRVNFGGGDRFNYHPVTQLHVTDFTDKPTIFSAEMVAGQPVNVTCSFNTTSLKHHGQNLTCRVRYPTVSSEQILTLNVQYAPQNLSITSPDNVNNSWVSVKEGNSAAILCSVHSFPTSNLTWRHLGAMLNTTRSSNELWMEFPQLTRQDTGVYQCVAENEHGTAERDVTVTVEYAPEISWDSGCTHTPESVTCVCAARCNPPGELTWRLPLANISGNQTRGRLHTWQVASGHLVNGSLTLRGGDGGEDVMALCSVRNRHGEALFKVYLLMEGEDISGGGKSSSHSHGKSFNTWIAVLLTAGIILIAELAGILIYKYIQRREYVTMEEASGNQDTNVIYCPHSATNQSAGSGADGPAPEELKGGGESGEGEEQAAVYANLRELPSSGDTVHSGEVVEYAELWFQSKQGEG
ncbi:sialic acid-binding Ig-like lectin 12 [Amblyraja radiata]|uniref:sialic acid-binding Ig-like lectin 12 n=1 Tax=Amblyraja radiata TaxID=386614 RepID=UPI0014033952|nr:sialic acid-binding Ig-like lectin 12 [Amblyraja radiata]